MSKAEQYKAFIEEQLNKHLPATKDEPVKLHKAMRYAVFVGGKRIRPLLCLAAAEAIYPRSVRRALMPALALEVLHTYTLVHDDLPAMDNDILRRGQPTVHVKYGEDTAILVGDALLTLAFELLAKAQPLSPFSAADLVVELAWRAGSRGVVGGQAADMAAEGKQINKEQLQFIHHHKTGDLIQAAVCLGAMSAGTTRSQLKRVATYGEKIGLAFQIVDDILNVTADPKTLGKAVGSDVQRHKATYVSLYGLKPARQQAASLGRQAQHVLRGLPGTTTLLHHIADLITTRLH